MPHTINKKIKELDKAIVNNPDKFKSLINSMNEKEQIP